MRRYRFGDFELDLDAVQLRLNGEPVKLERRPLDLLILLVTRHGELVTREEIITALWSPRIVVDFDSGLNTLVRKVRAALGDSADAPRFVETVQGRGYRFIGSVSEVDGEGSVARDTVPAPIEIVAPQAGSRRRWSAVPAALLLVVVVVTVAASWNSGPRDQDFTRIAVLPFENLTGSGELAYLADGLAEDTSTSLALVDLPDVRVIGPISTRAMADSNRSARDIGREYGVDYLLTSSLRFEAPLIRVTSHLIRTADGEQVWSASFDRELVNTLGLQLDLAIAIVEQVRQELSPEVAAAIDRRQTRNPEAYALYLKGRHEWFKVVPSANQRALDYYREAVARDPDYALAWAGIAHLLVTSRFTIGANVDVMEQEARNALGRAMAIDPDLAEVHYAKGYIHNVYDDDKEAGEAAARRAIELDPNSAIAHMLLGTMLSMQQRHVEATALMRRARELEPLSSLLYANSSMVAWHAGDAESGVELAKQAIAIDRNWAGYLHLGHSYLGLGDFDAALEAFTTAERLSGRGAGAQAGNRGYALARLGRNREARDLLAELESRAERGELVAASVADIYAGLGELDQAFAWLSRAIATNETTINASLIELTFSPLRDDPRFEAMLRCSGLC